MEPENSEVMRKETILKEDGRYLIYYHFEQAPEEAADEPEAP
ncbi:MAG TPA: hypothetical protein V6D05_02990 [Stenomitos sp.]